MTEALPYRSTPVFDQDTLPAALRTRHNTKAGVWGVIRVLEGELKLTYLIPPSEVLLTPAPPRPDRAVHTINSKWKFIPFPGQFSVKINTTGLTCTLQ